MKMKKSGFKISTIIKYVNYKFIFLKANLLNFFLQAVCNSIVGAVKTSLVILLFMENKRESITFTASVPLEIAI